MVKRVGTAGWAVPPGGEGSRLQRYAAQLNCVELNSSFRQTHRAATYARWAESVPADFRFSLKLPESITHGQRLLETQPLLEQFRQQTAALVDAVWLVQLPPKLEFQSATAHDFFTTVRQLYPGPVVCEPRHPGWFCLEAEALLASFEVARAAADPAVVPAAAEPGGWPGLIYRRWHGSPRMYYSEYDQAAIESLARALKADRAPSWCIFDNTAAGAALPNALQLKSCSERFEESQPQP